MKRSTVFALFAVSTLSLAASLGTLGVVLVGAKKMQQEVDDVRVKTNSTVNKIKNALSDLDL